MSKISQKLARSLNDDCEFTHDGQIKEFIIELGIDNKFKKNLEGEKAQAVIFGEHPTHFILIALYTGYEDKSENGYRAWAIPKRKYSYEQFMIYAKEILNPVDERFWDAHLFNTSKTNRQN